MNASHDTIRSGWGRAKWAVAVALTLTALATATGCDEWATWGGLVNPGYTSAWGLPAYPTLYDPTNIIQGVIDNRLGAMERVADNFGDFINQ